MTMFITMPMSCAGSAAIYFRPHYEESCDRLSRGSDARLRDRRRIRFLGVRRVQQTVAQFSELAQVPAIERQVRARDPFMPPASDELTASQVERLLRVQAAIRERLGARFAEFEKRSEESFPKRHADRRADTHRRLS